MGTEVMENKIEKYTYTRSLCMVLYRAVTLEAPGMTLRVEHSISHGQYCRLLRADGSVVQVDRDLAGRLLRRMRLLVDADLPFRISVRPKAEAIDIFRKEGLTEKIELLDTIPGEEVRCYEFDGVLDSYIGDLVNHSGQLRVFDLRMYKEGLLLLGPDPANPAVPVRPVRQAKMYKAFRQSLEFNRVIRVSCAGELNRVVLNNDTKMLINVAEAMHNKLLGRISDEIASRHRRGEASLIMLAGPSSSGKTTTCKRLAVQLMTNMMSPKMISLDDYFVNRVHTPLDADGNYDYESLYALDLKQFNQDLNDLLAGREINLPTYSFEKGERIYKERPLKLEKDDVLLIEGIHGLNPELTASIPKEQVYKVYVSALTSLRLDNHNWISTSDNRLLRRMVRDSKYRGTTPSQTLERWPSVRRGEEKWIFPFQENADAVFNSSLIFELGVMKDYLEPLLLSVSPDDPHYAEAMRLADFLGCFLSIPAEQVPANSLLREFLGGSSFHY